VEELSDVCVDVRSFVVWIVIVPRGDDEIRIPTLDQIGHGLLVREGGATGIGCAVVSDHADGQLGGVNPGRPAQKDARCHEQDGPKVPRLEANKVGVFRTHQNASVSESFRAGNASRVLKRNAERGRYEGLQKQHIDGLVKGGRIITKVKERGASVARRTALRQVRNV
jgi:hypothetical protein